MIRYWMLLALAVFALPVVAQKVAAPQSGEMRPLINFELKHADAGDAYNAVLPLLSPGWGSASVDKATNTLTVSDNWKNMQEIEKLIATLDVAPTPVIPSRRDERLAAQTAAATAETSAEDAATTRTTRAEEREAAVKSREERLKEHEARVRALIEERRAQAESIRDSDGNVSMINQDGRIETAAAQLSTQIGGKRLAAIQLEYVDPQVVLNVVRGVSIAPTARIEADMRLGRLLLYDTEEIIAKIESVVEEMDREVPVRIFGPLDRDSNPYIEIVTRGISPNGSYQFINQGKLLQVTDRLSNLNAIEAAIDALEDHYSSESADK